jgi:hypothetical protein
MVHNIVKVAGIGNSVERAGGQLASHEQRSVSQPESEANGIWGGKFDNGRNRSLRSSRE